MGLLSNRRALISGVANPRSLAYGIARAFHQEGAELAFTCFPTAHRRVSTLAAELGSDAVFECDVTDDDAIDRAFEAVGAAFDGRLDVFVHSIAFARLEDLSGEFASVTREGWRQAMDVSAYSFVAMARAARPLMKAAGGGSILTLTFAASEKVAPGYNVMGVAKAALESSVRYLAYDLGPDRIRVNALSPGPVRTVSAMVIDRFDEALARAESHAPLLRPISAEDVGRAALFLASDLSEAVTGVTMPVDAGLGSVLAGSEPHRRGLRAAPEEV